MRFKVKYTSIRGLSSVGRASALQAEGQGFESPSLHQSCSQRLRPSAHGRVRGSSGPFSASNRTVFGVRPAVSRRLKPAIEGHKLPRLFYSKRDPRRYWGRNFKKEYNPILFGSRSDLEGRSIGKQCRKFWKRACEQEGPSHSRTSRRLLLARRLKASISRRISLLLRNEGLNVPIFVT